MNMLQAVIFDMDGVIVDSESRHEEAFLDTLEQVGYEEKHGMDFSRYVGRSDRELWDDFAALHPTGPSPRELLEMKTRRVIEILRRDQPVFPGLPELVAALSSSFRLGLASGSEREIVEAVLDLSGLRPFFPVVVTCGEVARGKPEPDIFLEAARRLGIAPEDCWVIEDSQPGISAGLAAGMRVVAIDNTHPAAALSRAHYVAKSYAEIQALLTAAAPAQDPKANP